MTQAMVAVVTGATRGIGLALVRALASSGHSVVLSGRDAQAVSAAVERVASAGGSVRGFVCDVREAAQLEALWTHARNTGPVDVWINNAGVNLPERPLWECDAQALAELVAVNVGGVMLGTRTALAGMRAQGHGRVYNLEGFGAAGERMYGMAAYGASKRAVRYLTRAVAAELRGSELSIATLDPGIVLSEMHHRLRASSPRLQRLAPLLDALGDSPDGVATALVRKMSSPHARGATLRAADPLTLGLRLLTAPFRKRAELAAR